MVGGLLYIIGGITHYFLGMCLYKLVIPEYNFVERLCSIHIYSSCFPTYDN